jgi:hypothetical protein
VHAARAGATAADPEAEGTAAAVRAAGLDRRRLTVRVRRTVDSVIVVVTFRAPTDVPLAGALVGDVVVTGRAEMRVEGSS